MNRLIPILLLTLLLSGCAIKAPQKLYHFAYCNQMNADGQHCDWWATPCGKLRCQ